MMNLIIEPELEKCLPPLPEIHYQKLKASIEKKYDPAKPIVLWRERPNTIVDGHHRYRACLETGQEPTTIEESFASLEDAVLYALQRQIEQRNLTVPQLISVTEQMTSIEEKQKLAAAAKENLKTNQNRSMPSAPGSVGRPSAEVARKIAEKAHVSPREVYRFHKVKEIGSPELVSLMEAGEVGTKTAESFAKAIPDKSDQKAVIESGGQQAVFEQARQKRKEEEAKREAQKEAEAKQIEALRNTKQAINNDVKEFNEYVRETFGEAKNVCFKGAKVELWCSDCSWGFDVYNPNEAKTCPYCSGSNIKRREPDWWPGKKVI